MLPRVKGLIVYYITTIGGKRRRNDVNRKAGQGECNNMWYKFI